MSEKLGVKDLLPLCSNTHSEKIHEALTSFVYTAGIRFKNRMDVMSSGVALRIMIAFCNYEKTGNLEEFVKNLESYWDRHK